MPERRRREGVFVEFQPMSPEEVQRTMQFLLHQQAQFAADFAASQTRFDERFERLSAKVDQLADKTDQLADKTDQLADKTNRLADKTDKLADGLLGLTAIVGHVVDNVSRLAESQTRTHEQLQATSQLFERHLREDHGRRPS